MKIHTYRYHGLTNELFSRLLSEGKITERTHPKYSNLKLYKYAAGYNFFEDDSDTQWVEMCRGLVWDWDRQNVVANPMPKFHNHFNYSDEELQTMFNEYDYEVEIKSDGSCVLLWHYDGDWHWSTLGSFQSDQAKMAKRLLELEDGRYHGDPLDNLPTDRTYIFELIHPQNRIVLDYGEECKLELLAIRHRDTGAEYDLKCWTFNTHIITRTTKVLGLKYPDILSDVGDHTHREGWVAKFRFHKGQPYPDSEWCWLNVLRIKFKTDWYFKHSRIKQYFHGKNLVKHLMKLDVSEPNKRNKELCKYLDYLQLPPLSDYVHLLCGAVVVATSNIIMLYDTRAEQAQAIKSLRVHNKIKSALFCSLDKKKEKRQELVWKSFEGEEDDLIGAFNRNMRGLGIKYTPILSKHQKHTT